MSFIEKIEYAVLLGFCKIVGLLPNWFLYGVMGRGLYFLLYRIVGYRVKVVRENLVNSFPEKSPQELTKIEKDFYKNLTDIFIDTIKMASITEKEYKSRVVYPDSELFEKELADKNCIVAMSHFGSWEMMSNYVLYGPRKLYCVYRPLSSTVFDEFYRKIRSRFGARPLAMNDTLKEMIRSGKNREHPYIMALIGDQTPPQHEIKNWYRFLNQDTAFFSGIEKLAVKFKLPVFFSYITPVNRGHYQIEFKMIYDGQEKIREHEIVERYIALLEQMIRSNPHLWMWSHRRWKHKPHTIRR